MLLSRRFLIACLDIFLVEWWKIDVGVGRAVRALELMRRCLLSLRHQRISQGVGNAQAVRAKV